MFEKILNELENISYERLENNGMGGELVVNLDDAIEIVKQAAAERNNGWIPCSERLPEEEKEVLISTDDNEIIIGRLHKDGDGFMVDECGWIVLKHVIAWQSLPEPYTKGE